MYELAGYDQALSATQVSAHYNAASAWANDFSGARVNRILDAVGWPSADRNVETGLSLLQAEPQPGNALTSLTNAALAENGLLFQGPDGVLNFFDRSHLVLNAASNASQVTFGDGGGSERPYILSGIAPVMDDLDLWNDVQITATGGVMQQAQDTPSQTSYGTRSLALTGLMLASDNDSLSRAQHDLAIYEAPLMRVRGFTVTPHSDPTNLFPQVLGRALWDRITFKRRPPGGGAAFSQDSIIEGIAHKYAKAAGWETTFALSPADPASYFVLGTSTLDGSDVLFY